MMKYQLLETWVGDGVAERSELGIALDGSSNPERNQYVQCSTKEDAKRLLDHLASLSGAQK
jgi:hypothetical protein